MCQSIIATGIRWANFYFGSLVLSALNTSFLTYAFMPTRNELQRDADFAWSLLRTSPPSPDVASAFTAGDSQPSPAHSTAPVLQKKESAGPRSKQRLVPLQLMASELIPNACSLLDRAEEAEALGICHLLHALHGKVRKLGSILLLTNSHCATTPARVPRRVLYVANSYTFAFVSLDTPADCHLLAEYESACSFLGVSQTKCKLTPG